jgi:ribose transport system permease protein
MSKVKLNAISTSMQRTFHTLTRVGLIPIMIVGFSFIFALQEPRFLSIANILNLLTQSSFLIVIAVAQMLVLLVRGFDLSVGQIISVVSVTSAMVMVATGELWPTSPWIAISMGIFAGLLIGVFAGFLNGVSVAIFGVPPFIATLGLQGIGLGIASTISGGFPIGNLPQELSLAFLEINILGVPLPIAIAILICVAVSLMLNHTSFGRSVYLMGSNPRACLVAGIRTRAIIIGAYACCGLIASVTALMLTARTGSGEPLMGGGLMLQSIAAAVIGGVSLRGGEGKVNHCIFGAIFITILSNGMNIIRVDGYLQMIVLGVIIIAGVFVDRLRVTSRAVSSKAPDDEKLLLPVEEKQNA